MSCDLRAFSSLAAKRCYTLKSPALAFLKLNMYALVSEYENPWAAATIINYTLVSEYKNPWAAATIINYTLVSEYKNPWAAATIINYTLVSE